MKNQRGFTLLELAIVILLVGILMIPAFQYYDLYLLSQMKQKTRDNITATNEQISYFYTNTSRLPCPASPKLAKTNAKYLREADANCNPTAMGLTLNSCNSNGLCLVQGTRLIGGVYAPVIIGAFPANSVREINATSEAALFANSMGIDSWGRQLTYAVTLSLAQPGNYKFYNGEIDAQDEYGNATAGMKQDGQYALISHGRDGNGGYTEDGVLYKACGTSATSRDYENCDTDAVFMQGLGQYDASGNSFFDDIVYFGKSQNSILWTNIIDVSSGVAVTTNNIYNLNAGNVGIKTGTPTQQLDVAGTIKVDNNLLSQQICDETGANCFYVEAIADDGKRCNNGYEVMSGLNKKVGTAIDTTSVTCTTPSFNILPGQSCASGKYIQGFRSDGTIICTP